MQKQKRLWIDLRKLRIQRQWLQCESAEKLGISRSYLSAVENGKRAISMNLMEAIINVFNVKYEDFSKYDVSNEREHTFK